MPFDYLVKGCRGLGLVVEECRHFAFIAGSLRLGPRRDNGAIEGSDGNSKLAQQDLLKEVQ